jgi:hypothetical protein
MKLSGHEINSQLRQKLEMPTGRHLYVVLGTSTALSDTRTLISVKPDRRAANALVMLSTSTTACSIG